MLSRIAIEGVKPTLAARPHTVAQDASSGGMGGFKKNGVAAVVQIKGILIAQLIKPQQFSRFHVVGDHAFTKENRSRHISMYTAGDAVDDAVSGVQRSGSPDSTSTRGLGIGHGIKAPANGARVGIQAGDVGATRCGGKPDVNLLAIRNG